MTHVLLPAALEHVLLTVTSTGAQLVTQVDDDLSAQCLLLREPLGSDAAPVAALPIGTPLVVAWSTAAGRHELDARMVEVRRGAVPLWQLAATGTTRTSQDRRYARASDSLPGQLCRGKATWSVTVSDLSEGGARLLVPDPTGLAAHDGVLLYVTVGEARLQLPGRLLSFSRADVGRSELRVEFTNIGRAADILRRRVFELQIRARAASRARRLA
jgi:hypothetical protein